MNGKGSKENAGQTVQLTRLTHSSSGGVGTRSVYVAFRKNSILLHVGYRSTTDFSQALTD